MKKSRFILILVILTFLILGIPLFVYGAEKSFFYGIDPDVVYVTNALLYTKAAIIDYADHPGTPTIISLYYLFFPLRLIAKYVLHQGFIQWSFDNFAFLMYYCRIFEVLLYCLSMFVFLKSVFNISKSNLLVIFSWVSILTFIGFGWGMRVSPENTLFLLSSLWLIVFMQFLKKRKYSLNIVLVIIAGIALANKFTSIFLLVPSLFLPFCIDKLKTTQKIIKVFINILMAGLSFYMGIFQVIERFSWIKNWAIALFSHSGVYGTGTVAFFDWHTYSTSVSLLIKSSPVLFVYIFLTLLLAICLLVKNKIKINNPMVLLLLTTLIGIGVFVKYPKIHYLQVNFILIVFCSSYLLSKIRKKILNSVLIALLVIMLLISSPFGYIQNLPAVLNREQTKTVYDVLKVWTPFWASDVYKEQFELQDATKP